MTHRGLWPEDSCTGKQQCSQALSSASDSPCWAQAAGTEAGQAPRGNVHVSLSEALEVRGRSLQEEEIWAVLNQSAKSLQELFRKVSRADPGFTVSPRSLLLLSSGSVSFTDENILIQNLRAFTAP